MKTKNLILMTDSYKPSHYLQLPPGTEYQYSYVESRGGKYDKVVMFGLQVLIHELVDNLITMEDIDEAEEVLTAHGVPFNREGWEYIVKEHNGVLPLEIRAVPEGTVVPVKNAIATVVNTDPKCAWIVSYFETVILRAIWYGSTVATNSWHIKQDLKFFLEKTGTPGSIDFKLHDFGARGASSSESAQIGGMAHLVNFQGSDTLEAIMAAKRYYGADMAAFSIPASEHSTITSWERENEIEAYRNMIEQFAGPGKVFACVSDSYNIYKAIDLWKELEPLLLEKGGTLVIRPDSGDPATVIAGPLFPTIEADQKATAEQLGVIEYAMQVFGYTVNDQNYRVLPDHIRFIQGDGVNRDSINEILTRLRNKQISADNIAFGMGGALLQAGLDRDTQKFAMKCSAIRVNGEWRDVFKDPATDPGKASKKGRISLFRDDEGHYHTLRVNDVGEPVGWTDKPVDNAMETVYRDGMLWLYDFDEVRERANIE